MITIIEILKDVERGLISAEVAEYQIKQLAGHLMNDSIEELQSGLEDLFKEEVQYPHIPDYIPTQWRSKNNHGCMWDHIDTSKNNVMGLACNCPKCSTTC